MIRLGQVACDGGIFDTLFLLILVPDVAARRRGCQKGGQCPCLTPFWRTPA